jgi:uncharacterized protein
MINSNNAHSLLNVLMQRRSKGTVAHRTLNLPLRCSFFVLSCRIKRKMPTSKTEAIMDAETLVLAVLHALPGHEVRGRKRLQKLAFFAIQSGAKADARFFLHDFGPYSTEVAGATDLLSFLGDIAEEEAQFTRTKKYYKLYRLSESEVPEKLPAVASNALAALSSYTTIELEVASTIQYFMTKGLPFDEAIRETKKLKPSKSQPRIIQRAEEALSKAGLYEGRREDQVSGS